MPIQPGRNHRSTVGLPSHLDGFIDPLDTA
jgi:hypothetical protein